MNEIVKIDTDTLQVVGRTKINNPLGAVSVVPTPLDGRTLVVNCADNGRVLLVEAGSLESGEPDPGGHHADPDRGTGRPLSYAANVGDDTISVIDIGVALSCVLFRPATIRTASCFFPVDGCASRIGRTAVPSPVSGSNGSFVHRRTPIGTGLRAAIVESAPSD